MVSLFVALALSAPVNQPPVKTVFGRKTDSVVWIPTPWANEPKAGTRWMPLDGQLNTGWDQFAYLAVNEEFLP